MNFLSLVLICCLLANYHKWTKQITTQPYEEGDVHLTLSLNTLTKALIPYDLRGKYRLQCFAASSMFWFKLVAYEVIVLLEQKSY